MQSTNTALNQRQLCAKWAKNFKKIGHCLDMNFFLMLFAANAELVKYNRYFISTVSAGGLVFCHQGISNHIANYAPMHFYVVMV